MEKWKTGQLGHLDWVEMGLVATYPKSPSQSCGKRIDRDFQRMAWSTMLWVVDLRGGHLEREVMAIWWVVTGNNVRWTAVEQLTRRLDVEERQIWSAELDDVDEKNASVAWRTPYRGDGTLVRTGRAGSGNGSR